MFFSFEKNNFKNLPNLKQLSNLKNQKSYLCQVGCLKIKYQAPEETLAKNWKIFVGGLEKNASIEKSCVNYYPFGMSQPGRSFVSAEPYRWNFQGQETEQELWGGNASFFKYRISDNRLGRFFAVDPLAAKYPWNSTYAFSENRVIDAVELEGLESELVINTYNDKGEVSKIESQTVKKDDNIGPLGKGTYTVNLYADGTMSEQFKTEDKVTQDFEATGLSQEVWYDPSKGDLMNQFKTRIVGRLHEQVGETALIKLGFDEKEVRKDVQVYDGKSEFIGQFSKLNNADKYTKNWTEKWASAPHGDSEAKQSSSVGGGDFQLKYYKGHGGHLGIVWEGLIDHTWMDYIKDVYRYGNGQSHYDNAVWLKEEFSK